MTLRQVEVFLAVAREKSFSLAAEKIHLSQPTLSEHVRELEHELGKPLFFRRGRTVTLTEAGRVFEPYAASVVAAVEGARQAIVELDGLSHGSLLVGASTTPGLYVLPGIIARFRARSVWRSRILPRGERDRHPGGDEALRRQDRAR